jgi:hypothetical protein
MAKKINQLTAQPSTPADTDLVAWGQASGSGLAYKMTFTQLKAKLDAMGGGGGDVTPPTVVTMTVEAAAPDQIVVVFSEAVTGVAVGDYSFKKNGAAWSDSSVSGSGTTWTFTMATQAGNDDVLLASYSGTGTIDAASNALVAFADDAVTNNVLLVINDTMVGTAATDLTAHTPVMGGALTKVFSSTGAMVTNGDGTAKTSATNTNVKYAYANEFNSANQKVSCRLKRAGDEASGQYDLIGLNLRVDTSTANFTGYQLQVINSGTSNATFTAVYKYIDGAFTELVALDVRAEFDDGAYHDVSFEMTGSNIIVKVDGLTAHAVSDGSLTAGRKAVLESITSAGPTANQWIVDTFTAENI